MSYRGSVHQLRGFDVTKNQVENLGRDGFWPKEMWPPCSPDLNPMDFSIPVWRARLGLENTTQLVH